jgi:hypothetical protein
MSDNILLPYHTDLNWTSFTYRMRSAEVVTIANDKGATNIFDILASLPARDVLQKQKELRQVRHRFVFPPMADALRNDPEIASTLPTKDDA